MFVCFAQYFVHGLIFVALTFESLPDEKFSNGHLFIIAFDHPDVTMCG